MGCTTSTSNTTAPMCFRDSTRDFNFKDEKMAIKQVLSKNQITFGELYNHLKTITAKIELIKKKFASRDATFKQLEKISKIEFINDLNAQSKLIQDKNEDCKMLLIDIAKSYSNREQWTELDNLMRYSNVQDLKQVRDLQIKIEIPSALDSSIQTLISELMSWDGILSSITKKIPRRGGKSTTQYSPTSGIVLMSVSGIARKRKVWVNKNKKEFVRIKKEGLYIFIKVRAEKNTNKSTNRSTNKLQA